MRKRDTGYKEYGFDKGEDKKLKLYCRNMSAEDSVTLLHCAVSANNALYNEIYFSLVSGISYEELEKIRRIPIAKNDFYGYQRLCLYKFRDLLLLSGKWK